MFEQEIHGVEKIQRYTVLCEQRGQMVFRDYLLCKELNGIISQCNNAHYCEYSTPHPSAEKHLVLSFYVKETHEEGQNHTLLKPYRSLLPHDWSISH
jgi:DNA-directed RNA polymerase subunit L